MHSVMSSQAARKQSSHALAWLKVTQDVSCENMFIHVRCLSSSLSNVSTYCPISSPSLFCSSSSMWSELPSEKFPCAPAEYEFSQVMSPNSSTTSTTQRLLQRSSRMNPSTLTWNRCTRAMGNSTMSMLEKRYLHHCSLRREKNQRT